MSAVIIFSFNANTLKFLSNTVNPLRNKIENNLRIAVYTNNDLLKVSHEMDVDYSTTELRALIEWAKDEYRKILSWYLSCSMDNKFNLLTSVTCKKNFYLYTEWLASNNIIMLPDYVFLYLSNLICCSPSPVFNFEIIRLFRYHEMLLFWYSPDLQLIHYKIIETILLNFCF